jgi:serine/threonine-protein kinase
MPAEQSTSATAISSETAGTANRKSAARSSDEGDSRVGDFHLLRRLGKGGMAEVWLAEQVSLKRHVALKLLKRDLTDDPTYVKRFESEAKAAAGLNHPNIVQVYTVGQKDGQHYIAQEYVQGQTLRNLLQKKGPLGVTVALHVMRQVAAALTAAAERGIVHRDIKPENIMITRKGEVKVADFGLAQISHGEQLHLTQEGVTMGTPLYMSPEQVKGKKLDQRSDIYSFGVTCYHMLAGRPPFIGESAVAVAVQHLQEEPEPLSSVRTDLPQPLCDVVHRMMAKDPDERYPDAPGIMLDVRKLLKAVKAAGSANDVSLADLTAPSTGNVSETPRRTVLWRIVACVLLAAAGAGIGWLRRTPLLQEVASPPPRDPNTNKLASAQDQFVFAMFHSDSEAAWQAVRDNWQDPGDESWRIRATEQLALLYLKQPDRHDDARRELAELGTFAHRGERYALEKKLGEAALAAYGGDSRSARSVLDLNGSQFDQHLTGGWHKLYEDLQSQLSTPAGGTAATPLAPPSGTSTAGDRPGG